MCWCSVKTLGIQLTHQDSFATLIITYQTLIFKKGTAPMPCGFPGKTLSNQGFTG